MLGFLVHGLTGADSEGPGPEAVVHGQAVWPPGLRRAPAFSLRDQDGRRFTLASVKGEPVILTFMDSRCHQQCPLVGRALAAALRMLPRHLRPTIVAVSVDPWADTPASARRAMERFGLAGFRWRWLLGSKAQLEPVWHRYRIGVRRTSGDIEHADAIYLIDGRGYERAGMVYPFLPVWVSDDLKTLAGEGAAQ
jgi:protein SCO1